MNTTYGFPTILVSVAFDGGMAIAGLVLAIAALSTQPLGVALVVAIPCAVWSVLHAYCLSVEYNRMHATQPGANSSMEGK